MFVNKCFMMFGSKEDVVGDSAGRSSRTVVRSRDVNYWRMSDEFDVKRGLKWCSN